VEPKPVVFLLYEEKRKLKFKNHAMESLRSLIVAGKFTFWGERKK